VTNVGNVLMVAEYISSLQTSLSNCLVIVDKQNQKMTDQ